MAITTFVAFAITALAGSARAQDEQQAAPSVGYTQQIAPILNQYCVGCHGVDEPENGLVLETYEGLLAGGKRGAPFKPGDAEASLLIGVLTGTTEPQMPPEGNERPTLEEIALLRAWIAAGAPGPRGEKPDPRVLVTPKVELLAPARQSINAVAVSPDGKLAAAAGYATVRLLDTSDRSEVRRLEGLRGNVTDVRFSNDGKRLIAAAGEPGLFGEATVWRVADGRLLATLTGHRDSLYAAALSPDGKTAATASYDQKILLWDVAKATELRTLEGHNGAVLDVAFSPNGDLLASASADRTAKLWRVADGARLDTLSQSLEEVHTLAFSPDGALLAAGGADHRVRVWRLGPKAEEGTNELLYSRFAHEGALLRLVFSRNGKRLVTSADDRTIKIWDTAEFTQERVLEPQSDWPSGLAFLSDDTSFLVGRLDGSLAVYNATTGKEILPPKPELATVWPMGLERGKATRIQIAGKYLAGASRVTAGKEGQFEIRLLPGRDDVKDSLWAEVRPAADLARGSYPLVVHGPGGASAPYTLHVDDVPQIAEREPNELSDSLETARLPAGFWGRLARLGDEDCFAFEVDAPTPLVCELAAARWKSPVDGVITLFDPDGQVVATNNDFEGQTDPLLAWRVERSGRYVVRVNDLVHGGSGRHFYRLLVGSFPYVTGSFPLAVTPGSKAEIELVGYNLPHGATVSLTAPRRGEALVPVDPERYRSRGEIKLVVDEAAAVREREPNDTPDTANPLDAPCGADGRIRASSETAPLDVDLYRFRSAAGRSWVIETIAQRRGSPLDTKIEVLDAAGQPVERVLLQAVRDSNVEFRSADSDKAGFRVKNWEEMHLDQYLYVQGEVCKIFQMPRGPDSDMTMYTLAGKRRCYFDTSATSHALFDDLYVVVPQPPDVELVPNGLPVFPIYYANDDDGERKLGKDSKLLFTAPADGEYLVRVSDVRGQGGDRFAYRLSVREPRPDFNVTLAAAEKTIAADGGLRISVRVTRDDGFDGEITVDVDGLPPGFSLSTPVIVQRGHVEAQTVLVAAADAKAPPPAAWSKVHGTATAEVDGRTIAHEIAKFSAPELVPRSKVLVRLEPPEVTIRPGTTVTATLEVERNDYDGPLAFDVHNLPHGVIVDNIGLNGIFLPAGKTERKLFLTAEDWIPDVDRQFFAETKNFRAGKEGGQASPAVTLHVRHEPTSIARAESAPRDP